MTAIKKYVEETVKFKTATPQTVRTPGRTDEVQNSEDGYVFSATDRQRLERFLILGVDGGTYYVGERDLTQQNVQFVLDMIARDEAGVVSVVNDVRTNNRAAKQSPAIFVAALVLIHGQDKNAARALTNVVCQSSTQLFEMASYIDALSGWGRSKRKAIAGWYLAKTPDELAYQVVKYRQRNGWTHRDLFRLSHPVGVDQRVGNFILGKDERFDNTTGSELFTGVSDVIVGFKAMQRQTDVKGVLQVLDTHSNLPWETIPTQFLTDASVWKKIFYNGMGQTALLRNVTRFAKIGAFNDLVFAGDVAAALANADKIAKGRMHPVQYANALGVYTNGTPARDSHGWDLHRQKSWTVNAKVSGALEAGFYESFKAVTPANKATMVSVDVSGSMGGCAPAGLVGMNCSQAAALMAMVTVRTEPYVMVNGFDHGLKEINLSATDSLETVFRKLKPWNYGGTDCALPMVVAKQKNLGIDTFQIYTDGETWAGAIKPNQAVKQYRQSSGRNARVAVVGLASNGFTLADPTDPGMLDFVGFDSAAPKVMADFSAGRI